MERDFQRRDIIGANRGACLKEDWVHASGSSGKSQNEGQEEQATLEQIGVVPSSSFTPLWSSKYPGDGARGSMGGAGEGQSPLPPTKS